MRRENKAEEGEKMKGERASALKEEKVSASGIKFYLEKEGEEIGRAYLFLMHNGLHKEPFGLVEDVFVKEEYRRRGLGSQLVKAAIKAAKEHHCYKLICTSRHARVEIHKWYQELGFKNYGLEFRMELE